MIDERDEINGRMALKPSLEAPECADEWQATSFTPWQLVGTSGDEDDPKIEVEATINGDGSIYVSDWDALVRLRDYAIEKRQWSICASAHLLLAARGSLRVVDRAERDRIAAASVHLAKPAH